MRVKPPIPLRRELLVSFAVLFAAAIILAVNAVLLILPLLTSPGQGTVFVTGLLVADLCVLFGVWILAVAEAAGAAPGESYRGRAPDR